MQFLTAFAITFSFAAVGWLFMRFQVKPLSEFTPKRNEVWESVGAVISGISANYVSIALYERFITTRKPFFSFLSKPLSPVTIRTMILGALMGTLAVSAVQILLHKRSHQLRKSDSATLLRTSWKALTIALFLEVFLFNFRHHEQIFQQSPDIQPFTPMNYQLEGFEYDADSNQFQNIPTFVGRRSVSVEFEPMKLHAVRFAFAPNETTGAYELTIEDALTGETYRPMQIHMTAAIPRSLTIPIDAVGESRRLTLIFPEIGAGMTYYFRLTEIELNPEIPFRFETNRFAFVTIVLWLLFILYPENPIASKPLDLNSRLQRGISAAILLIIIFELAWTIASNYTHLPWTGNIRADIETFNNFRKGKIEYYSAYHETTDALLAGQLYLLDEPDETLLNAEYPYDPTYRIAHNVVFKWDRAFYNGKYYTYFGVVPVMIAFLPFKAITGLDLPLDVLMFLFALMAVIGLKKIVTLIILENYINCSFGFYCLSVVGVTAASLIQWLVRRTLMYELANQGGITFSIWAVYWMMLGVKRFITKAKNPPLPSKGYRFPFALSGLCAGLAVGCRPNTVFILLWLVYIVWEIKPILPLVPKRVIFRAFFSFAIPISGIAILLMAYNFGRYGSVMEFGFSYQMSYPNAYTSSLRISPFGMIFSIFAYLFHPLSVSFDFPFFRLSQIYQIPYIGYIQKESELAGLFAFPYFWSLVLFFLPIRKQEFSRTTRQVVKSSTATSALLIGTITTIGIYFRYLSDFAWIAAILSLAGWLYHHQKNGGKSAQVRRPNLSHYAAVIATSLVVLYLTLQGFDNWHSFMNPISYEKLRYLYCFWL